MGSDGVMTLQERLELREKQLAACTRAITNAATKLREHAQGDHAETWLEGVADELMAVRAGTMAPKMELVLQRGRLDTITLLTEAQGRRLDTELLKRAKGEANEAMKILFDGERYPLDAVKEID